MSIERDDGRYPDECCRTCRDNGCYQCPVYTGRYEEEDAYDDREDPGEPIRGSFPRYNPSMRKE